MSEPCPHERGDHDYPAAIGSFVAQTRALTAMTAERDAALAALARVEAVCVAASGTQTPLAAKALIHNIRAAMEGKP